MRYSAIIASHSVNPGAIMLKKTKQNLKVLLYIYPGYRTLHLETRGAEGSLGALNVLQ